MIVKSRLQPHKWVIRHQVRGASLRVIRPMVVRHFGIEAASAGPLRGNGRQMELQQNNTLTSVTALYSSLLSAISHLSTAHWSQLRSLKDPEIADGIVGCASLTIAFFVY